MTKDEAVYMLSYGARVIDPLGRFIARDANGIYKELVSQEQGWRRIDTLAEGDYELFDNLEEG